MGYSDHDLAARFHHTKGFTEKWVRPFQSMLNHAERQIRPYGIVGASDG
jgi:hypothetical protein